MSNSWVLTSLLALTITANASSQQYDLLQGIQQFLQPVQPNQRTDPFPRQTNKQQYKHRWRADGSTERNKPKKHYNELDYVFGTTSKPSIKVTKGTSSQNYSKVVNNRHVNTDFTRPTSESNQNRQHVSDSNEEYNNNGVLTNNDQNRVSFTETHNSNNERGINREYDTRNSNRNVNDAGRAGTSGVPRPVNRPSAGPANRFNSDLVNTDEGKKNNDPLPGNTRNVNVANLDVGNDNVASNFDNRRPVSQGFGGAASNNPFLSRPGVVPADVETGTPPLTNRPTRDNGAYPTSSSGTRFGTTDVEVPQLLSAPNEDQMTRAQKRKYTESVENLCREFKQSLVQKISVLPLLPNAKPITHNVSSCRVTSTPLIINGKIVDIRDFPHMALVGWMKIRDAGYSWKCGGSLISDQFVLTAAHCAYQETDTEVVSGPPQAVQLGSTYLDDPGALVMKIEAVYRHPKYRTKTRYHDIALLKLKSKLTFSEVIRPACIGTPPSPDTNIVATGWGRTEIGGDGSFELRSAALSVWDLQKCSDVFAEDRKLPNGVTAESHVCAADKKSKSDTCQGDSGGPAQIQEGCVWRLVAVTSFGHSCALPNTPALYAVIPRAMIGALLFPEPDVGDRGGFVDSGAIVFRD